jgi:pilus assembly protein CpaB
MKPKTMILMGVAIVCGLGASYMTSRLLAERGEAPAEQKKVNVLVAKKNVDMGIFLKSPQDVFIEKQFTLGDEPKNAVVTLDVLKNKYLKRSLRKDDWITPDDLADSGNGINWQLPEGLRAIGLRVSTEGIAGGWASLPGSRVDVISTIRGGNNDDSFSQVLLEDVLILAADGANKTNESGNAMPASVVTMALPTEDALKVTLASQLGPLHLMLRKQGDKSHAETDRVSVAKVIRGNTSDKTDALDKDKWEEGQEPANPRLEIPAISPDEQPKGKDIAKGEPVVRTHVITFIDGEHQRKVVYRLGENNEVLSSDVPDAEPSAPPAPAPANRPPSTPPAAEQNDGAPAQPATPPAAKGKGAKSGS